MMWPSGCRDQMEGWGHKGKNANYMYARDVECYCSMIHIAHDIESIVLFKNI